MPEWIEGLRERLEEPWGPASPWMGILPACFLLWVALGRTGDGWMPFLDGINLIFHEAGHPIFGIFGWETLAILGGTLMQLLVPLALLVHFWIRRQPLGVALCGQWMGQNLLNIARYMADAQALLLPLVGGGEHDWSELFVRWGVLHRDAVYAGRVVILGWITLVAWALWFGGRVWASRRATSPG